jgi:hypothetical protein
VPAHGGPPVSPGSDTAYTEYKDDKWSVPYDPTANRNLTSVQSLPLKGAPFVYPPDLSDGKVYEDEWVAYLRGARPKGSLPTVYAMDNEPDLWADATHVDVHPVRPGYDDMLSTFLAYARAVRKADPEGLIAGPESWGVTGYLYSALDEGGDKFATAADRQAHGDTPFLEWFLKQVAAKDKEAGARSLDLLSLHYYPNAGQYEGGNDAKTQASRIQAPRALWDGLYVEDSWVAHTEWANLGLLRRVQKLVDDNYPGTKTAISEWNFGGEDDISGALATADALGIFGREGAYFATYWGLPRQGSPTGWAFRLYRNYDGNGAAFGTRSVDAQGADPALASAYAALNDDGSRLTVMLINKDAGKSAEVVVKPRDFAARGDATVYRYSTANLGGIASEPLAVADPTSIKVNLQPMSIALLVLDRK